MLGLILSVVAATVAFVGPEASGHPERWVTSADYPAKALLANEEADPGFTLIIGIDGRPISCQITSPSRYPALDEKTCALMMARGQFKPASLADGSPIISTYKNYANWRINSDGSHDHPPFGDVIVTVSSLPKALPKRPLVHTYSIIDPNGIPKGCYVKPDKLVMGLESLSCQQVLNGWKFTPLLDKSGSPVESVQSVIVAFETDRSK